MLRSHAPIGAVDPISTLVVVGAGVATILTAATQIGEAVAQIKRLIDGAIDVWNTRGGFIANAVRDLTGGEFYAHGAEQFKAMAGETESGKYDSVLLYSSPKDLGDILSFWRAKSTSVHERENVGWGQFGALVGDLLQRRAEWLRIRRGFSPQADGRVIWEQDRVELWSLIDQMQAEAERANAIVAMQIFGNRAPTPTANRLRKVAPSAPSPTARALASSREVVSFLAPRARDDVRASSPGSSATEAPTSAPRSPISLPLIAGAAVGAFLLWRLAR